MTLLMRHTSRAAGFLRTQGRFSLFKAARVGAAGVFWIAALSGCERNGASGTNGNASLPIPQPVIEATDAGGRRAMIDVDALRAWCKAQGLPPPPTVSQSEPGIAESLTKWLDAAGRSKTDENFGAVGQICYVIRDYDAALAYLERAEALNPRDSRWPYFIGVIYQEQADDAGAIAKFKRAIELKADIAIAHGRLAQVYVDRGDLASAEEHASIYNRIVPRDSLGPVLLGRIRIEEGKPAEAIPLLEAAIARIANDFQAHHYLGRALAQIGRTEEARSRLDYASSLPRGNWFNLRDPLRATAVDLSGSSMGLVRELEAVINTDQWDTMAGIMERIIALRVGDFKMMANLADVYRKQGRFKDAHAMIDRALELAPEMAELYSKRAALHLAENQFDQAVVAADRAIEGSDSDFQAYSAKGRALFLLKRYEEAAPALRRAVEIEPKDVRGWQLLGIALHHLDRLDEAADCYRRVQSLVADPEHPIYRDAESNLNLIDATESQDAAPVDMPGG